MIPADHQLFKVENWASNGSGEPLGKFSRSGGVESEPLTTNPASN